MSPDLTLKRVTQAEADAICRWAGRRHEPVRGPNGLPLSTITAYALSLALGDVRKREFPVYDDGEEMSPLLVLHGPRTRWEATGEKRPIRPADIVRLVENVETDVLPAP
jgi:hypothetical protein